MERICVNLPTNIEVADNSAKEISGLNNNKSLTNP
jgi:hypothetical protein